MVLVLLNKNSLTLLRKKNCNDCRPNDGGVTCLPSNDLFTFATVTSHPNYSLHTKLTICKRGKERLEIVYSIGIFLVNVIFHQN